MATINPSDIEAIIKTKFPSGKISIKAEGEEPEFKGVSRYSIRFVCLDTPIEFKLGYNLVLLIDGRPTKFMPHMPISGSGRGLTLGGVHIKGEFAEIEEWLDQISKYIQQGEVPKVQELARKFLGKEEKVQLKKGMIIIYYDVFFVIIIPHSGGIYKNKGNRLLYLTEFDKKPIETFFRLAKDYANMVRTDQL